MTIFSAALLLFMVMDPVGNVPMFLTALQGIDPKRQRIIVVRELFIALAVLIAFLFGGQYILQLLNISEPSLTIAGGIILFLIALRMIFPNRSNGTHEEIEGEPLIVPLAIPLIAGPSAMASVMFVMSSDAARWLDWLLALLIAWAITAVILFMAGNLRNLLGKRGLIAIERLMGMILTTIAVQMVLTGVDTFMSLNP